jgi:hypothetical protein
MCSHRKLLFNLATTNGIAILLDTSHLPIALNWSARAFFSCNLKG